MRKFDVLYEDDRVIVVDKASGVPTMADPSGGGKDLLSLVSGYLARGGRRARAALVHRLDRDASGVILLVKGAADKRAVMASWNDTARERKYRALVEGDVPAEGRLESRLEEGKSTRMRSGDRGLLSITDFRLIARGNGYSLVEASLQTGRRNQIRVQFAEAGHPVAGDRKYGAAADPIGRLALHATLLAFIHPGTGELVRVESPCPDTFMRALGPRPILAEDVADARDRREGSPRAGEAPRRSAPGRGERLASPADGEDISPGRPRRNYSGPSRRGPSGSSGGRRGPRGSRPGSRG